MAVFGDLGSVNAKSISYLQEETQQGKYDVFLHVGRFYIVNKIINVTIDDCLPKSNCMAKATC